MRRVPLPGEHVVVIQRFADGYLVRLIDGRGKQLLSTRCATQQAARRLARAWAAAKTTCRIDDRT